MICMRLNGIFSRLKRCQTIITTFKQTYLSFYHYGCLPKNVITDPVSSGFYSHFEMHFQVPGFGWHFKIPIAARNSPPIIKYHPFRLDRINFFITLLFCVYGINREHKTQTNIVLYRENMAFCSWFLRSESKDKFENLIKIYSRRQYDVRMMESLV